MERARQLRAGVAGQGRQLPPLAIGLATGEVLLSSLTAPTGARFSASGPLVSLARQLARLARPGEILLSGFTLRAILENLPPSWEILEAENEQDPDLSDVVWQGDEIHPLPPDLQRKVTLLGPNVSTQPTLAEFYLDYLYAIRAEGFDQLVPVLRVVRPEGIGSALELSEDNIVSTPVAQILGKYKLLDVIGQGGMGKVWRGMDRFGNLVAIKVLHSGEATTEESMRRFEREAEIMARLPHRNICRIFEISEYEGLRFIVMEYVKGLTLADLLYENLGRDTTSEGEHDLTGLIRSLRTSRELSISSDPSATPVAESSRRPSVSRILPVEQTLTIFEKICEAIQFAHEHGVLHRDLKPGNVLLREDGEPLVADFGLAKLAEGDSGRSLSVSGYMVGTLENMAPEQAESSKDVDERADVFSLGTILFQMLTGHRHFAATGNLVADAQALRSYAPPKLRAFNPSLDPDLELICQKALRPEKEQRYRSVEALRADLARFRRGEVISARPVTALELTRKLLKRNRGLTVTIASFLLLLSGVAVWSFWQINERRLVAEAALKAAEDEAARADAALLQAEEQRRLAESKQQEAEEALQAKSRALVALQQAQEQAQKAREAEISAAEATARAQEETVSERTERQRLESAAREMEEELSKLRTRDNAPSDQTVAVADEFESPKNDFRPQVLAQAREAFRRAGTMFLLEFSSGDLQRQSRTPREIVEKVRETLDHTYLALTFDPQFGPALLLAARLHLALSEWDKAETALASIPQDRPRPHDPPAHGAYESQALLTALRNANSPADKTTAVLDALQNNWSMENETTIRLLQFFNQASTLRRNGGSNGAIERAPTLGESLLALKNSHPDSNLVLLVEQTDPQMPEIRIQASGPLSNLSALATTAWQKIQIKGATQLDWESLGRISPRILAIRESPLEEPPPNRPGLLARVVEADFADTRLTNTGFLRGTGVLEKLDLSNTGVTDLSGLDSPRLRSLNLSGLQPESIAPLSRLPLYDLTIGPELASQPAKIQLLRFHRTLKVLRLPTDPPDQSSQIFWQKLDLGYYATESPAELTPPLELPSANQSPAP
jgi:serine/threonine protein kinase/F0F1-type ATP synthase membrane subunit b/b'